MTSLPISLPNGAKPLVSVGDTVKKGQVLATLEKSSQQSSDDSQSSREVTLSLPDFFGDSPSKVGKYLLKTPGDSISVGEVLAVKKGGMTLQKVRLVSQVKGIILRFERSSGNLIIRLPGTANTKSTSSQMLVDEIISPLDGKVSLCNNEKIVLESESDSLVGTKGSGYEVMGELDAHFFDENTVVSSQLTRDSVDKIVLVKAIEREALVKADAIGIKGIITTTISDDDIAYLQEKHPGLPVVEVDEAVAKKLQKTKTPHVVLNGQNKTIIEAH